MRFWIVLTDIRQPPAGASNDDKPLFEIPATTTLADIVQLIRETYHARSNRQDKTDKQIAALNDKINHPRRRSNSISSSASDASDRDIIRTNNDPQQTPTRTPKLPTPTPQIKTPIAQIPSPFPQAFTPVLQSRNLVQLPRPRAPARYQCRFITSSLQCRNKGVNKNSAQLKLFRRLVFKTSKMTGLQSMNSVEANNNINNNYRPISTFCQKPGHTIDICFKRTAQTNNQNFSLQQNSNVRNYNNYNIQVCNYCQKPGHTIDICFKRRAQENKQNLPP
ncbi:hypothetical protein PV325_005681 [Microctonus aethiopoides]|nr:hypothetical protein PV325_005681 [Microctonus aethiopoides]